MPAEVANLACRREVSELVFPDPRFPGRGENPPWGTQNARAVTADRPPYGAATLAGAGVLLLYVLTLAPTTAWWDASEYIATAQTLGVPHPPGNPFFVALARVWSMALAPLGLTPAVRINLFAAVTSAAASSFLFLVAHRTLRQIGAAAGPALVGAAVSALVGATTYTVWSQSNANEKVYTLSVLIIAATSWLVLRWRDRREEEGSERLLLWAGYLMALGATSHLMSVLPALAVLVLVGASQWRLFVAPGFLGRVLLVVALGLSFNFFLPLRAAQEPVINEGASVCASFGGAAAAIYTGGRKGCPALGASLRREQYQKPPLSVRMAPLGHQLLNYFQYFDWQWARSLEADEPPGGPRTPVTLLFLALGVVGLAAAFKGDLETGTYLVVLVGTVSVALVFYLNFEFGYTLAPEITDRTAHEVRERDYFFLASFSIWGVLAGLGLAAIWIRVRERLADPRPAGLILAVALVPLAFNWSWASRAGDYAARDWAYNLLMSVEPYGIIFTNGDNDTFPLWYLQEVEGIRQDVTVAVVQYLFTDWYAKQLRELTRPDRQRPYVAHVEGLYPEPTPPTGPVLMLSDDELDRIRDTSTPAGFTVRFGSVSVEYPEGMFLGRGHLLVLAMISSASHERPIYFAGTGGEMQNVGLAPWGVNHGLATKLVMRDLEGEPPPGYRRGTTPGADWFDVPRSVRLVDEVYQYRGLRDREIWPDPATFNIPAQFYFLSAALSELMAAEGDTTRARVYGDMTRDFLDVARGGRGAYRSY